MKMEPKMLDKNIHVDLKSECLCRYVRSDTEYFRLHYHNYYELFLVMKGEVCHIINSKEQIINEGQLLFIRDFDIHDYKSVNGNYFEFINLSFTKEAFEDMCNFFGEGFSVQGLLKPSLPPIVSLSQGEKEKLAYSLIELNTNSDKNYVKYKMRYLLSTVFTKYFHEHKQEKNEIPSWLEITYEKMKNPKNFIEGVQRLFDISGKSREHTTRCIKKYYGVTPTQFVSNMRLEYSANLLLISNLGISQICYECGFENLSWFYKIFEKKYSMTPNEYRKKYKIK